MVSVFLVATLAGIVLVWRRCKRKQSFPDEPDSGTDIEMVCVCAWDILVYWFMGMGMGMHMSSLVHGYALHLTLPNPSPMVGNLMG